MRLNNVSFPHPVLGIAKSILSTISINHRIVQNDSCYDCHFECIMGDRDIQALIDEGRAKYFCEATCSATLYRKAELYSLPSFDFSIGRKQVRGTVSVFVAIVSVDTIPNYVSSNRSGLYRAFDSFYIEKGDLLAVFGEFPIEADIQYEKLKAVSQIFVVTGNNLTKDVNIDLDGEKITVNMHPDDFAIFSDEGINKNVLYAPLFHASIVLNALIAALRDLESYGDRLWAKTIKRRLETEAEEHPEFKSWTDPAQTNKIAQILLNYPYNSALKAIKQIDNTIKNE